MTESAARAVIGPSSTAAGHAENTPRSQARWTPAAKRRIYDHRVRSYRVLAEALAACTRRPMILLCASGMGIYPSSGDRVITEDSPLGTDFLAGLQRDGEAATAPATAAGIRVVHLRFPMVIGGANLVAMTRNLRPMGGGHQWWSWVALDEIPPVVEHVLATPSLVGAVNVVSPNPALATQVTSTLGRVLGRPVGRRVPALLLRVSLGEMAGALLLASRRIEPRRLTQSGYRFRHPELDAALRHQLRIAPDRGASRPTGPCPPRWAVPSEAAEA